jgi:hypothetical protein
MKVTFTAALFLAAIVGAAVPGAAAPTPGPSGPIRIDYTEIAPMLDGELDPQASGYVNIRFTNVSSVAATSVVFAMEGTDNQPQLLITDKGTFGPNVVVQHHFFMPLRDRNLHVIPVKAVFADGSTWVDNGDD